MEDRYLAKAREQKLEQLKQKIRDPHYLQQAVSRIAGNLTNEYYLRTQR